MRKFKVNIFMLLFVTVVVHAVVLARSVEGASAAKKNALKMAKECGYYIMEFCDEMTLNETKAIKMTDKTKLTIALMDYPDGEGVKKCVDLFGEEVSIAVLPLEKNWETNLQNYSKLNKLVVRLEDGEIVSNVSDTGDHYFETRIKSFKKKGSVYTLKVNNYCCVFNSSSKHKFAETTLKLVNCKKSKYNLKIKGIKIKKVSEQIYP